MAIKENEKDKTGKKDAPNQPISSLQNRRHRLVFQMISLLILVIGMSSIYCWQHQKVVTLQRQVNNMQSALIKDSRISLDKLNALEALPNVVVDTANSPTDLIAFLGSDNTQCYKNYGSGYYKVVAQVRGEFAEMQYGCTAKGGVTPLGPAPDYILARKTNTAWQIISPTNQWLPINNQSIPSCKMVNDNAVSMLLTPTCWQGPALGSGESDNARSVIKVTNP